MTIYKILIHEEGTLETFLYPTIFCDVFVAEKCAKEIAESGSYEDHEISSVCVYAETPEYVSGVFRTKFCASRFGK